MSAASCYDYLNSYARADSLKISIFFSESDVFCEDWSLTMSSSADVSPKEAVS
jgi:hypothetical protein